MFLYQVLATCSPTPVPYPVLLRSTGLRQAVSQAGLLLTGMRNQYGLIKAQKQLTERLTEVLGRSSENGRNQDWPPSNHRQYQASGYTCVSARRWQTPGAPPPTGNRMLQPLSCPAAQAPSHVSWESRPKQEFRAGRGLRPRIQKLLRELAARVVIIITNCGGKTDAGERYPLEACYPNRPLCSDVVSTVCTAQHAIY